METWGITGAKGPASQAGTASGGRPAGAFHAEARQISALLFDAVLRSSETGWLGADGAVPPWGAGAGSRRDDHGFSSLLRSEQAKLAASARGDAVSRMIERSLGGSE